MSLCCVLSLFESLTILLMLRSAVRGMEIMKEAGERRGTARFVWLADLRGCLRLMNFKQSTFLSQIHQMSTLSSCFFLLLLHIHSFILSFFLMLSFSVPVPIPIKGFHCINLHPSQCLGLDRLHTGELCPSICPSESVCTIPLCCLLKRTAWKAWKEKESQRESVFESCN